MHEIVENIDATNTKKQINTAVRTFREYLTSKHMSVDFESLSLSLLCWTEKQKRENVQKGNFNRLQTWYTATFKKDNTRHWYS